MSNPKLEIFKFTLDYNKSYPSFQKLISSKVEDSDHFVFLQLFQKFLNSLADEKYHKDVVKKKAFTGYDLHKTEHTEPTVNADPNKCIIEGTIEGGKWGRVKRKSKIVDKTDHQPVEEGDVITDKYYFLIYTPLNSDIGIIMIHSYSSDSISDIFTKFICEMYSDTSRGFKKCKLERFFPQSIIQDFTRNSSISRFSFSTRMVVPSLTNGDSTENSIEEFVVKIEAAPGKNINQKDLPKWVETLQKSFLTFGKSVKSIDSFNNKKVYLQDQRSKKASPYELEKNNQVSPVIYLDGRITVNGGIPSFSELKTFCINLLEDIKQEVYPINKVNEH